LLLALPNAAVPILMVCLPLSAALFLQTWRAVPKSFQIGTAREHGRATAKSSGEPVTVWMPVLRSLFAAPPYETWALVFVFLGATNSTWIGACCFYCPWMWLMVRPRVVWLRALPVRRRVALRAMLAPVFLTLALGYVAGHLGHRANPVPGVRLLALHLTAMFGFALMMALLVALYDWRRIRHVRPAIRGGLLALLLAIPYAGSMAQFYLLPRATALALIPNALLRVSQALPGSLEAAAWRR
jgi:hypothetical protein